MAIDKITTPAVTDDSVTLAKMAPGTDGNIISYDASGNPVAIATGNDGQVLTSTGAGSPPAFETLPVGSANTPRFHVYNSSDQSISNTTNTQINFNSEFFDSNGAFANSTFTVPSGQAGFYLITMRYIMSGSFNARMILYLRNNSTDIMGIQNHHETTDGGIILTTVVELAAGSTATARAYQDSGSTRTIVGGYQWNEFSGFKLI